MSEWGPKERVKRDVWRRYLVGAGLLVSFAGVMIGGLFTLLRVFELRHTLLLFSFSMTVLMFSLVPVWSAVVCALRRKVIEDLYGIDLRGARAVEVSLVVRDADVGKDVGFVVFRHGTFAFLGLRSRFAFVCRNVVFRPFVNGATRLHATVSHKAGQTEMCFVPNDRIVYKGRKARKLFQEFSDQRMLEPPREWFDVLPPSTIDPTVEVTEKQLANLDRLWIVYVITGALPILSIVFNVMRGDGPWEHFTIHSALGPVSVWFHTNYEKKTAKGRFAVHEEIRQGRLAINGNSSTPGTQPALVETSTR